MKCLKSNQDTYHESITTSKNAKPALYRNNQSQNLSKATSRNMKILSINET